MCRIVGMASEHNSSDYSSVFYAMRKACVKESSWGSDCIDPSVIIVVCLTACSLYKTVQIGQNNIPCQYLLCEGQLCAVNCY